MARGIQHIGAYAIHQWRIQRAFREPPPPNYFICMRYLKNEMKSAIIKANPHIFIHMNPLSRNHGSAPVFIILMEKSGLYVLLCFDWKFHFHSIINLYAWTEDFNSYWFENTMTSCLSCRTWPGLKDIKPFSCSIQLSMKLKLLTIKTEKS